MNEAALAERQSNGWAGAVIVPVPVRPLGP